MTCMVLVFLENLLEICDSPFSILRGARVCDTLTDVISFIFVAIDQLRYEAWSSRSACSIDVRRRVGHWAVGQKKTNKAKIFSYLVFRKKKRERERERICEKWVERVGCHLTLYCEQQRNKSTTQEITNPGPLHTFQHWGLRVVFVVVAVVEGGNQRKSTTKCN